MKLNITFLVVIYILIILLIPGIAQTPEIEHHGSAALEDGKIEFDADGTKNGIVVWTGNKKHLLRGTYYVDNHTLRIEPGAIVEADQSAGGSIVSNKSGIIQHEGVTLNNITLEGSGTIDNYIRNCILNNCKIRNSGWMEISESQFNSTSRSDIIQVFNKDFSDAIPIIKNNRFSYTENSIKINLLGANAYIEGNSFIIEETQRGYDYAVYLGYKKVIDNSKNDTAYYPKSGKTTILNNEFTTNDFGFSDYSFLEVPHKAIDQYQMAIELKGNTFEFGRKIVIPVHSDIQILNNTFNGRGIDLKKYPIAEESEILRKPHQNFKINNNEFYFAGTEDEAITYWGYRPEDPPVDSLRNEGFFINAADNWWGHDTGPFNDNNLDGDINLGGGLKISDIIDYKPFIGTGPASDIIMELKVSANSIPPFHPHNNVTFYPSIEYEMESGAGNIELDVRLSDGTLLMTTSRVEISAGDNTIDLSSLEIEIPENTDQLIFQARFLTASGPDTYSNKVKFDVHLQTSTIQITDLRLEPPSEGNYIFQGDTIDITLDLSHTFTAANPGNTGTIEIITVERNRNSPLIIRHQYRTITLPGVLPGENRTNTVDMQLDIQVRDVDNDPTELFITVKLTTDAEVEVSTEISLPIDKLTNQTEITDFAIKDVVDGKPTLGKHSYFKANEVYIIGLWFATKLRTPNVSAWRLVPKMIFYDELGTEIETRYFRQDESSPPIEFELNYGEQSDQLIAISLNPVPANSKQCKIIAELISNEGKVVHKHEIDIEVRNPTVKNEQPAPEGNSEITFDAIPMSIDLQYNQTEGLIQAFQYQGPYEDFKPLAKSISNIKQLNKYWELVTDLTPGTYSASVSITYNPETDFPPDEELEIDLLTIAFWDTLAQDLIFLDSNHDKENFILTANVDYLNSTYVIGYQSPTDIWDKKESEIPNNYRLFSNYPNPFNPTTKIKFSIPLSDNVQIKIYDILGNEIKTILNDYKQVGTYETEYNASNLPSGVYFYRIISGNFLETKKMILLK